MVSVIVGVLVLAVVPVVVVTTLCVDLPADFACRELFRVDIPVSGV
jgi:hypothetical protein